MIVIIGNIFFSIPRMKSIQNMMFLCVTSSKIPSETSPHFSLSNPDRPESSFLGYLLRRKVLSIETVTSKANDAMIIAVNWLSRIFNQLVEFCQKNQIAILSMKHFMVKDLPLESSHQFRIW